MVNDPSIDERGQDRCSSRVEIVWLPRQLRAFRHRNYQLYFFGLLVSFTGSWIQQVALSWLVLQLTNSALLLGVVGAIGSLPVLLFSLPAGVIADRVDKRNLIVVTQTGAMILALTLAALTYWKIINIYHIITIGFLSGVVNAFDWPTRQSFVIEMVGKEDLVNAIALNSATFNGARVIGPALAGVILVYYGMAGAFLINGVSYLAVIAALLVMQLGHFTFEARPPMLQCLKEGLRFIRGQSIVKALLLLAAAVSIFAGPYIIIMPIFARDILHTGPGGLGWLMCAVGAGALAGVITLSSLGDFRHKGKLLLVGNLAFCAAITIFSFSRSFHLSMGLLVFAGWGFMIMMALMNTLIQLMIPDELRGRVLSFYTIMVLGMAPVGSFQIGAVAHWLGAPWAVRISAMACATVALLLSPRFTGRHAENAVC